VSYSAKRLILSDSISFWGRTITEDQAVVVAGPWEGGIVE